MTTFRTLIATTLVLFLAGAAEGQVPRLRCIALGDGFSEGDEVKAILRTELSGSGIRVLDSTARHQDCYLIQVQSLSESVVVLQFGSGRRVLDLGLIAEALRPRSIALAISEELDAYRSDAPDLRPPPDPSERERPDTDEFASVPVASSPAWSVLFGGVFERLLGPDQTLAGGRAGLSFEFEGIGYLQWGIEGRYWSNTVSPFGTTNLFVGGVFAAWIWELPLSSELAISVAPEVGTGLAWAHNTPSPAAIVNSEDALALYVQLRLSVHLRVQLADSWTLSAGPHVGAFPKSVDVRARNEVVGGLSGVALGGRLELSLAL